LPQIGYEEHVAVCEEELLTPLYPEVGAMVPKPNSAQEHTVVSISTCSPTQLMQPFEQTGENSNKAITNDLMSVIRADHDMLVALEQERDALTGHEF
jgi:hypothetical protein